MKGRRICRRLKGSFTVEMAVIMPMILFLILECVLVFFYYHDKNILAGAAYETAVVGSTKAREEEGLESGELEQLFQERIRGKCILFPRGEARVQMTEDYVVVQVNAVRSGMKIDLAYQAAVTDPEREIRKKNQLRK